MTLMLAELSPPHWDCVLKLWPHRDYVMNNYPPLSHIINVYCSKPKAVKS